MVLRQRVVMLGYIDSDGVARMQEDMEEKVAWCLAPVGDGKVGPRLLGTLDRGQTISLPDDSFLPLSPIFGMEIGRVDLRDYLVSQHSSRDEKEEP